MEVSTSDEIGHPSGAVHTIRSVVFGCALKRPIGKRVAAISDPTRLHLCPPRSDIVEQHTPTPGRDRDDRHVAITRYQSGAARPELPQPKQQRSMGGDLAAKDRFDEP